MILIFSFSKWGPIIVFCKFVLYQLALKRSETHAKSIFKYRRHFVVDHLSLLRFKSALPCYRSQKKLLNSHTCQSFVTESCHRQCLFWGGWSWTAKLHHPPWSCNWPWNGRGLKEKIRYEKSKPKMPHTIVIVDALNRLSSLSKLPSTAVTPYLVSVTFLSALLFFSNHSTFC